MPEVFDVFAPIRGVSSASVYRVLHGVHTRRRCLELDHERACSRVDIGFGQHDAGRLPS